MIPASTSLSPAGTAGPILEPDASITVLIVSSIPDAVVDGKRGVVELRATAVTGSGTPGTTFAGKGAGGGDAVVGAGHADAKASGGLIVHDASVVLEKTATVVDPYGGSRTMAGSVITYRLTAKVIGSGSVPDLRLLDTVPVGTEYLAGTLVLDARAISDAVDGDEGSLTAGLLTISLGTVQAGAVRTAEFKVKIKTGATL